MSEAEVPYRSWLQTDEVQRRLLCRHNTQTTVEDGSHMIVGFKVTDSPTDHGQINELASEAKTDVGADVIEAVADKGYQSPEDNNMSKAL